MSNKILCKAELDVFHLILTIPLLLPAAKALEHFAMLFFIIYSLILYVFYSLYIKQFHICIDNVLIKYPLSFWKNDVEINYSDVIEFKHKTIRAQEKLQVKYKDMNNKIKTINFPCNRSKANMLMKDIQKKYEHIKYKTYER